MPPKAILLLDNCTAHLSDEPLVSDDGNIVTMMLPPNVTAVIQPMDQNPIKVVKLIYRNMLLSNAVAQVGSSVDDTLKKHSIKDAILYLKVAWDQLPQTVLQKAWTKIVNWDEKEYEEEDNIPLSELIPSKSIYDELIIETQQLLSQLGVEVLSVEEIEDWNVDVVDEEVDSEPSEEENPEEESDETVPYGVAIEAVNDLLKWCAKDVQYGQKHVANLIGLRSDIVKKHFSKPQKQTTLDNFFAPK